MGDATGIEWTDATWNPVTGCSRVSEGCRHCYAMRMARRLDGRGVGYDGTTVASESGPRWSGKVNLHPDRLEQPLRWRKPRRVFVCSMSDLFHEDVPFRFIAAVFGIAAECPQHTFQILTKRPERMAKWFRWVEKSRPGITAAIVARGGAWPEADGQSAESALCLYCARPAFEGRDRLNFTSWPLRNVWLGTSCEDQATADERIPWLLECPAAIRYVSLEPLLGRIDLRRIDYTWRIQQILDEADDRAGRKRSEYGPAGSATLDVVNGTWDDGWDRGDDGKALDWVIAGGESGPGARGCDIGWLRDIVDQCQAADVPVFVKQLGAEPYLSAPTVPANGHDRHLWETGQEYDPYPYVLDLDDSKGGDPAEWPEDLRVRQMPEGSE